MIILTSKMEEAPGKSVDNPARWSCVEKAHGRPEDVLHEGVVEADRGFHGAKGHDDDGEEGEEALQAAKDSVKGEIRISSCHICVGCPVILAFSGDGLSRYWYLSSDHADRRMLEDTWKVCMRRYANIAPRVTTIPSIIRCFRGFWF